MTIIYLKLVTPVLVVLVIMACVARSLGAAQPPNPALRGFVEGCEDQPQPCWYGIVPGVTDEESARSSVKKAGYSISANEFSSNYIQSCQVKPCCKHIEVLTGEAPLSRLVFYQCDIVLGDLMLTFDPPITPLKGYEGIGLLGLEDSKVGILPTDNHHISPYMPVTFFFIQR